MRRPKAPLLLCALVACGAAAPASAATVRVFAAASLTEAFREIAALYRKAHPGDRVELSFAGSQVLRAQIEQGAPADVFASADTQQMEPLRRRKLVEPYRIFAHNPLVVVASRRSGKVRSLKDLAKPGVRVVVAGPSVPVGRYASQVLEKLGALHGRDFPRRVAANVVSREVSVRGVLAKVALGEADAGFVYATDAPTAADRVRVLAIPRRHNVVGAYPIAVVAGSRARPGASAFVRMVLGPQGQRVLRRFGFLR